jgi:hypothetical protein
MVFYRFKAEGYSEGCTEREHIHSISGENYCG